MTFPTSIYIAMRYKLGYSLKEVNLSDSAAVGDAFALTIGLGLADPVSASDAAARKVTKVFSNTVQLTDSLSLLFNGGLSFNSAVSTAESGAIRSQGYCDFSYFEADYVGTLVTF